MCRSTNHNVVTGKSILETGYCRRAARSGLFHRANLATLVVAAVRAHLVRRFRLAALRTSSHRNRAQSVVGSTLGGSRLGMAAFGIRHVSALLLSVQQT